jgi:hypothetical protein
VELQEKKEAASIKTYQQIKLTPVNDNNPVAQ